MTAPAWLNAVATYGADPTGAADSTTAIQNMLNAVSASGAVAYLPSGTYKVSSTLTCTTVPANIIGDGRWATVINFTGTGDCLRIYDSSNFATRTQFGGSICGITIDGTSAGGASTGLHLGDVFQYSLDVGVQNFTGAGSIGVHLDNAYYWTEQLHGEIYAQNCAAHVVFDVTGGGGTTTSTGSFARLDLACYIDQGTPSFNGVVLKNGAFIYDGRLAIRGNFGSSASALTSAVLTLTGSSPSSHPASESVIFASHLDVQAECASGTHTPQTIVFGAAGTNFIRGCDGILDFAGSGANFTASNIGTPQAPGALWFMGVIAGDSSLCPASVPAGSGSLPVFNGTLVYTQGYTDGVGGLSYGGDFFQFTLSQNTTMVLDASWDFAKTLGAPQRLTIVITQAASSSYTVTWPHAGSPTTSSPTVLWAGGTAPAMTTTHGATDVYKLETVDGIRWYGQALQHVS